MYMMYMMFIPNCVYRFKIFLFTGTFTLIVGEQQKNAGQEAQRFKDKLFTKYVKFCIQRKENIRQYSLHSVGLFKV